MRTDADRDRCRLVLHRVALGDAAQVVGRYEVDPGEVAFANHVSVHAGVQDIGTVAGDRHSGGNHRSAVELGEQRDGQAEQVDLVAHLVANLSGRSRVDLGVRDGVGNAVAQLCLDFSERAAVGECHALLAVHDACHHRHVVTGDVLEQERLVGLLDQCPDVANIGWTPDSKKLPCVAERVQYTAKVVRHPITSPKIDRSELACRPIVRSPGRSGW